MKHYIQRKFAMTFDKGMLGGSIVKNCCALSLLALPLLGCTKTPADVSVGGQGTNEIGTNEIGNDDETKSAAATGPGVGDTTEGENGDTVAAHSEQPAPGKNNSPIGKKSTEKNLPPIDKTLPKSFACGDNTCYRFAESRQALVPLILAHKAQLIAFGEAHAPASFKGTTTVSRFTHDLLPTVSDGASHLLLELLNPPKEGCQKEKKAAEKESKKITKGQAQSNQNEYMVLGTQARERGVVPDILWSTCEDLAFIASPEGGVIAMMETIAKLSTKSLKEQLSSRRKGRPLVLAYGGALHNDATPRSTRATWSYGPAMIEHTKGSYLEVDLIVPELIGESESWKSFAWYNAYQTLEHKDGAVLMRWGDKSYALFLEPGR